MLQGWSAAETRSLQLCVASNMPYLDMNYYLAPEAALNNGAIERQCITLTHGMPLYAKYYYYVKWPSI